LPSVEAVTTPFGCDEPVPVVSEAFAARLGGCWLDFQPEILGRG
jgi:hypothetical protein